jgi:hypothetical protein
MAGTYYVPYENGDGVYLGRFYAYFRLKISQSYNAVSNESTLTITPQVKCTKVYAPTDLVFRSGDPGLLGGIYVDGRKVGTIGTYSGSSFRGQSTTMNTWVTAGTSSTYVITVSGIKHADNGAKTITVSYERFLVYGPVYEQGNAAVAASGDKSRDIGQPRTFTLTISAGTGSSVTVKRGSTTLNTGDSVTYGETLTVTFAAQTGYNLTSSSVSGATHGSGSSYTVTGPMTAAATATKKAYTLTISQGPNSTIKVTRNGSALSTGATVYYGDQLAITMTANSGYHLTTSTVSGASKSGSYYVVNNNVVVTTVAEGNTRTLYIRTAEGVSVSVTKNGTALSNNADIAVGDVLTITATAATGYENATVTVTGATKGSDNKYTVTDNVTVTPSATKRHFTLAVSPATGSSISVMRGSEELSDGDTIYYGDTLVISATADSGYGILTLTVNGSPFANGATHVVSAAVTVATTTEELVGAYLRLAAEWLRYALYINSIVNGWGRYVSYIQTTTGWVKY